MEQQPTDGVLESTNFGFMERARNYTNHIFGPNLLRSNESSSESFMTPAQFGYLTGLLIILYSNYHIDKEKCWNRLKFFVSSPKLKEYILITVCFLVTMLTMPSMILTFAAFSIYKRIDERRIKANESNFKGFLNGEDIVWACEDDVSKSIINILAFVQGSNDDNFGSKLLESIRERFHKKLVETNKFPKMFYRRRLSDSGYFYWSDDNPLTVKDYVRPAETTPNATETEFRTKLSQIVNNPLPADNTALWECLIGQQAIQIGDDTKYAVSCW